MLAPEFYPVWGGVGTYVIELARHLPKDFEIHVVTPERAQIGSSKKIDKIKFHALFGDNVHLHYISKANDTFFYNASFQMACLNYIPKLVKESHIDIIHSHTAQMPDLLLMLRNLRIPVVTTVHTTIRSQRLGTSYSGKSFLQLEKSEQATFLMYPYLRAAERFYFSEQRCYISPSNWMKNFLETKHHISQKIAVIPNSVDISDYANTPEGPLTQPIEQNLAGKNVILYVGRLLAMKGVDAFIEAIPEIVRKSSDKNLLFVFAGPGDRWHYLHKLRSLKIEQYCYFTGALPKEAVIHLMKLSKLLVVPSFIENVPYTILEAMACGVAVVASDVGGISEIITDGYNGKLVDPNYPSSIADAVTDLSEDGLLSKKLGDHARSTISDKFSWKANLDKYCELYCSVIGE